MATFSARWGFDFNHKSVLVCPEKYWASNFASLSEIPFSMSVVSIFWSDRGGSFMAIDLLIIVGSNDSREVVTRIFVHCFLPSSSVLRRAFWASMVMVSTAVRMLTLYLAL